MPVCLFLGRPFHVSNLPDYSNVPVSAALDHLLPSPSGHLIFDNSASSFVHIDTSSENT